MPETVQCDWLRNNLDNKKVKILDVTHTLKPKKPWEDFANNSFGKFRELMIENVEADYVLSHIPGAVHFNIDVAYYPSQFLKLAMYPPEIFEKYIRMLGINEDDHIVLYSRGPAAGMLFAARAWWTFKLYGHQSVSVLNGGFAKWTSLGYQVNGELPTPSLGNWSAKPIDESRLITFEDLSAKNEEDKSIFDECEKVNYFDARAVEQYTGNAPLGVPAPGATGSHIRGSKNFPLAKVLDADGLKPEADIKNALIESGYIDGKPIITACNGGIQACVLSLALEQAGFRSKVFNGSMVELGARASELINSV